MSSANNRSLEYYVVVWFRNWKFQYFFSFAFQVGRAWLLADTCFSRRDGTNSSVLNLGLRCFFLVVIHSSVDALWRIERSIQHTGSRVLCRQIKVTSKSDPNTTLAYLNVKELKWKFKVEMEFDVDLDVIV